MKESSQFVPHPVSMKSAMTSVENRHKGAATKDGTGIQSCHRMPKGGAASPLNYQSLCCYRNLLGTQPKILARRHFT